MKRLQAPSRGFVGSQPRPALSTSSNEAPRLSAERSKSLSYCAFPRPRPTGLPGVGKPLLMSPLQRPSPILTCRPDRSIGLHSWLFSAVRWPLRPDPSRLEGLCAFGDCRPRQSEISLGRDGRGGLVLSSPVRSSLKCDEGPRPDLHLARATTLLFQLVIKTLGDVVRLAERGDRVTSRRRRQRARPRTATTADSRRLLAGDFRAGHHGAPSNLMEHA